MKCIFFITETKGAMSTLNLSGVENAKITCAKKPFIEMSTEHLRYYSVVVYDDLL